MTVLEYAKSIRKRELEELNREEITQAEKEQRKKCQERDVLLQKKFNILQRKKKLENQSAIEKLDRDIDDIDKKIKGLRAEANKVKENVLPTIEKAETLRELKFTFGELDAIAKDEGEELKFGTYEECLMVTGNEYTDDKDTMMKAVAENPSLIAYDKTDNKDVYAAYIDRVILEINKENEGRSGDMTQRVYCNMMRSLRDRIIDEPHGEADGKYVVPNKHIFEAIRGYIEEGRKNEGVSPLKNCQNAILHAYNDVNVIDGKMDKADVEKLEEMYTPDNNYYVHATAFATPEQIFKTGLRASGQPPAERKIERTAYNVSSFLSMAGYTYQHTGTTMKNNILLRIPKDATEVWGAVPCDGTMDEASLREAQKNVGILDNYLLPEFVIGAVDTTSIDEWKFVKNNEKDKTRYHCFYKDGSPMGEAPSRVDGLTRRGYER